MHPSPIVARLRKPGWRRSEGVNVLSSCEFVGYAEASPYFDGLTAPLKGFYTFSESAHSPMLEEPDKVMAILREDVLNGTNRLADRK